MKESSADPRVRIIFEVVGEQLHKRDAKLAETNARIDQIEALVKRHDKLDRIIADPMNDYALECMKTGEDRDWEFAEQVEESVPVVQELKKKWTRSTH